MSERNRKGYKQVLPPPETYEQKLNRLKREYALAREAAAAMAHSSVTKAALAAYTALQEHIKDRYKGKGKGPKTTWKN